MKYIVSVPVFFFIPGVSGQDHDYVVSLDVRSFSFKNDVTKLLCLCVAIGTLLVSWLLVTASVRESCHHMYACVY